MEPDIIKQKAQKKFKLEGYYFIIEIITLLALVISFIITQSNRSMFLWIRYPEVSSFSFVIIIIWNSIFFVLKLIFQRKIFFTLTRYGFIIFFFLIIYATGGVNSNFIMLLLFPLFVAVVDLNEKMVKWIGILITILYALLIFVDPVYLSDWSIIVRHGLQVFLYGILSVFAYSMVKDTLRQRFEIEDTKKKFVRLIELDKLKSSFVGAVSHQLRTPLTGVKWAIDEISLEEKLPSDKSDILKQAKEKIDISIDIVNKMLKTADIGVESFNIRAKESIKPYELLREIISELFYLTKQKHINVILSGSTESAVLGDREMFKAAIMNVVDNAVRYSSNGDVKIQMVEKEEKLRITVIDQGVGIPEEDKNFIFERFFRGKNAVSIDPNESGIGLYITKNIIELHGGTVSFISELGKGTTVTIVLPILRQ